jgi:alkylation response protein AidB-like acyl-CoA dehydrogenase
VGFGGQGLPFSLAATVAELMTSANHAWSMYSFLSSGGVDTIRAHGTDEQKNTFIPNLVSGRWSATMCLTESHCGSDLGLLHTKAEPNDDGSYAITGEKIFISAGEHDLTENIIHIVLARLPDAPDGIDGISLFIVPKIAVNADGSLGDANGVSCGSIEHKMGINGSATCVINFDGAKGFLLGPANKGMGCMFTFINESRLGVAQQGHGHIEVSFQNALAYAKDRLQMRAPVRAMPDKPADPIIVHPNVRRMLLTQKALAESGRLLNYYCAKQVDLTHSAEDPATRERAQNLLALLTPIAKGFLTELSMEATSYGIQVLGGHGYIREWGLEQEYRDTRITAIYEGTNGIQALDLLGRKVLGSAGELLAPFIAEMKAFCADEQPDEVKEFIEPLSTNLDLWVTLTKEIGAAVQQDPNSVGAASYDYLMLSGYVTLAYFWARSAATAARALAGSASETDFYRAKLTTARFYFERLLPRTASLAMTIRSGTRNLMELDADHFAF